MFVLSQLLDSASAPPVVPQSADGPDMQGLSGKEYRFPIQSTPPVRLPKDASSLAALLSAAGEHAPVCWAALTSPQHRVLLEPREGARRAALVTACVDRERNYVLAVVTLAVRVEPARHMPPAIVESAVKILTDREDMLDELEKMWAQAAAPTRAAFVGAAALWLGGTPATIMTAGDDRIRGVGAAFGLKVEVVNEASRHVQQIATRLGSDPPLYVIVWRPGARNVDPAVRAYLSATAEGEVIELTEPDLPDALIELRWALAERGLADGLPVRDGSVRTIPAPGEERFYIKYRGSGVGDVMIDVPDCGHQQWGSDERSRAPRALKGISRLEQATPKALHLCARCSKHRWRARF